MSFDDETTRQPGPAEYRPSAQRQRAELSWSDAAGAHTFVLDARAVVGSGDGVDIVVSDPAVSRLHAEFDLRDGAVWVRDLGSRNGTFVSGVLVAHACVPDGGRVRVGSSVLNISRDAPPASVPLWPHATYGPLLGGSVAMRELFARVDRIAQTDLTVLILGETGSGKELVARALHDASPRRAGPFVVVDCAALPENLLEGELFGHARGAFTGAVAARAGAIEAADGGTVFLDEIGELPIGMQPKLLRTLESHSVRRIGEHEYRRIDVRFVSATNRDLRMLVNTGGFREDVYFRLAVVPISIPPLRSRPEDLVLLAEHFAESIRPGAVLSDALLREIRSRPWMGNVRELRNFVSRAVALGSADALAFDARGAEPSGVSHGAPVVDLDRPFKEIRDDWVDALEREYIRGLLERHQRNVASVATAAGLDRTWVYRLIKKHDL